MDAETRGEVFSAGGRTLTRSNASELLFPPNIGGNSALRELEREVRERQNTVLVESLIVVPRAPSVSLLDIYNALSRVRGLRGRTYHSHTRNRDVALFEEASRLRDGTRRETVADPPPAAAVPSSETVYMNLRDINFGSCFYRADFSLLERGAFYSLTNFKTIYYIVVPVIREGRFLAGFYIEPLAEGVLIYCAAVAEVSDFVAKRVDMPSAIEKRLGVFQGWVADGIGAGR
jgi:hypothetical protein